MHLRISRTATTLVLYRIGPLKKLAHVEQDGIGPQRRLRLPRTWPTESRRAWVVRLASCTEPSCQETD